MCQFQFVLDIPLNEFVFFNIILSQTHTQTYTYTHTRKEKRV